MKKKILVVDDADSIRYLLKTTLETEGYSVTQASSGAKALELIKGDKPDLVVLDIMMPGMDGWEVCKRIKDELKLSIPVLILTARADDASKRLSREIYKVAGYLTKPFLKKEIIEAVKEIIG